MPRTLTSGVTTEVAAGIKRPCVIAEIQTATSYVRAWSGIGDLVWGGNTYQGVGQLGGVSAPEETTALKATGIVYTLSGIPSALLSAAVSDLRPNLPARLWLGFLDASFQLIADPVLLFEGTAGVPSTDEAGDTCSISISAENLLASLKRPRVIRFTPEDQANRDATDKGFDYNAALQDRQIAWGRS